MQACVGVSCKYMLVFFLITTIPRAKPMSHLFQECSLLFSGPVAGFLHISLLHCPGMQGNEVTLTSLCPVSLSVKWSISTFSCICACSLFCLNVSLYYTLFIELNSCQTVIQILTTLNLKNMSRFVICIEMVVILTISTYITNITKTSNDLAQQTFSL